MTQTQVRQIYQQINNAYNKMAEVREELVPGLKEAKQMALQSLVELESHLKGDWNDEM
jgi:hypothetical protein